MVATVPQKIQVHQLSICKILYRMLIAAKYDIVYINK